jgi:hypothetical protein
MTAKASAFRVPGFRRASSSCKCAQQQQQQRGLS